MKVISFINPETGTTAIVHPAASNKGAGESEADFLARVAARAVPDGVAFEIVEAASIPADRTFRNALKLDKGAFVHDMDKAREIHMARIRAARDVELAKLDVETMKALGKGDTAARDAVEAEKDALRDIPQSFDLTVAATADELKALWPDALK